MGELKLEIEVEDFLQEKTQMKNCILGSLHIYLCAARLDIRGIYVKANLDRETWSFLMPTKFGTSPEGKRIIYPVVSYDAPLDRDLWTQALLREAVPFILNKTKTMNGYVNLNGSQLVDISDW